MDYVQVTEYNPDPDLNVDDLWDALRIFNFTSVARSRRSDDQSSVPRDNLLHGLRLPPGHLITTTSATGLPAEYRTLHRAQKL